MIMPDVAVRMVFVMYVAYSKSRDMHAAGSSDVLREEVLRSAWYEAFRADMRSSAVVRAVETSLQRVSTATSAATAWTSSRLARSFQ